MGTSCSRLQITEDFRDQQHYQPEPVRGLYDYEGGGLLWAPQFFTWAAPSFYHRPLYFEQVNLERYGYGPWHCLQPLYSSGHFFGSVGLLPYKMLKHPPHEKSYTLGHGRPGDCVPYQRHALCGPARIGELFRD